MSLTNAFLVTVAPDFCADDGLVSKVDRVVADCLAFEVIRNREDLEVVLLKELPLLSDIRVIFAGEPGVKMISPTGKLESVISPLGGVLSDRLERQIGPLPGKERYRVRRFFSHFFSVLFFWCGERVSVFGTVGDGVNDCLHGVPVLETR